MLVETVLDEDGLFRRGISLFSSHDELLTTLRVELDQLGEVSVGAQLERLYVPIQKLGGSPESFSFLAWGVPRLTREERHAAAFVEARQISLVQGRVRIDLDEFSRINWFYFNEMPDLFAELSYRLEGLSGCC